MAYIPKRQQASAKRGSLNLPSAAVRREPSFEWLQSLLGLAGFIGERHKRYARQCAGNVRVVIDPAF
jgi:hypothetical protein